MKKALSIATIIAFILGEGGIWSLHKLHDLLPPGNAAMIIAFLTWGGLIVLGLPLATYKALDYIWKKTD